jgi:hypothetical protein
MDMEYSLYGETANAYTILFVNPEGRGQSEDLDVGGRIILTWVVGKLDWRVWIGLVRLRIWTVVRLL